MPVSRRRVIAGLATLSALSAAPALAGCGDTAAATPPSGAEGGGFPVTIKHKYGETTIPAQPQRVVLVGLVEQDAMLALGVVPVAVTDWFADGTPGCIYPWAKDKLGDAALPTVLDNTNGVQTEKIAGLAPDLIIGQYAGLTQSEYDLLSKIAPTVAQPGEFVDYGVPWQQLTQTIGTAIGKADEASKLVADVEATLDAAAAAHPEFKGKTGVTVTPYEGIYIYGDQDPRNRMLISLGFEFPDSLRDPDASQFGWSISAERAGDLADIDALVWLATEKQVSDATGKVWDQTTAAKQGRGVFISEATPTYYVAQSFVTVLSIPYTLERIVPQLAAAVDGDPGTAIPTPAD